MNAGRLGIYLVLGAIVLYGTALVITIFAVPSTGTWEDTAKTLGVAVAIATGIFAPVSSMILAQFQARIASGSAQQLEKFKATSAQELEKFKASLSAELEVNKALIAARVRAFDAMLTAAHFLYFAIRKQVFRPGEDDIEIAKQADRRAAEASAAGWCLSGDDRLLWFEVYDRSMTLLDKIRDQPEKRTELFDELSRDIGHAIQALGAAGLKAMEEADRQNVKTKLSAT